MVRKFCTDKTPEAMTVDGGGGQIATQIALVFLGKKYVLCRIPQWLCMFTIYCSVLICLIVEPSCVNVYLLSLNSSLL